MFGCVFVLFVLLQRADLSCTHSPADSWTVTLLYPPPPCSSSPPSSLSFELRRDSSNDSTCLYCHCHSSCLCVCCLVCVYIRALKLVHVCLVMTATVYNALSWQGSFGPSALARCLVSLKPRLDDDVIFSPSCDL